MDVKTFALLNGAPTGRKYMQGAAGKAGWWIAREHKYSQEKNRNVWRAQEGVPYVANVQDVRRQGLEDGRRTIQAVIWDRK